MALYSSVHGSSALDYERADKAIRKFWKLSYRIHYRNWGRSGADEAS